MGHSDGLQNVTDRQIVSDDDASNGVATGEREMDSRSGAGKQACCTAGLACSHSYRRNDSQRLGKFDIEIPHRPVAALKDVDEVCCAKHIVYDSDTRQTHADTPISRHYRVGAGRMRRKNRHALAIEGCVLHSGEKPGHIEYSVSVLAREELGQRHFGEVAHLLRLQTDFSARVAKGGGVFFELSRPSGRLVNSGNAALSGNVELE